MIQGRKVTAIIVVRFGSSRFPGKALARIAEKPALKFMIDRVRQSKTVDNIVVATTASAKDQPIIDLAKSAGIKSFAGSEADVLDRVLKAAQVNQADIILYLTGDCPFIDPEIIDQAVEFYGKGGSDFVCNYIPERSFPNGVDVEVFSLKSLESLSAELTDPWDREHITGGFIDNPIKYHCVGITAKKEYNRVDIRITLDEQQDLERLNSIAKDFKDNLFRTADIVRFLDVHPDLKGTVLAYEPVYTAAVLGLGMAGSLYDQKPSSDIWSHSGAYDKFGRTRLIAGCDPDAKKRELFKERWGCQKVFASADELFSNAVPDIVSITAPDNEHYPMLCKAAEAGVKAIFCEKPISRDIKLAAQMVALCRNKKILLAVNHWHRWSNLFKNLRKFVIEDKGIGDIQHVLYWYTKGIFNSGSHVIDILRWFFGDIAWVKANNIVNIGRRTDPNIDGFIMFKSGVPCTIATVDWRKFIVADFDIIGSNGRIRVNNEGNLQLFKACNSKRFVNDTEIEESAFPYPVDMGMPMLTAVQELYSNLVYGGESSCRGEDALEAVRVVNSFTQSGRKCSSKVF